MTEPATHFRDTIRAFLERTGTAPARLGADVPGDPSFVHRLMQGRDPRLDTADRVRAVFDGAPAAGRPRAIVHRGPLTPPITNPKPKQHRKIQACPTGKTVGASNMRRKNRH